MKKGFGVALLALGAISTAQAIVRRDDKPESLYLDLAAQPQFSAVGIVAAGCTGTLIAPEWVMTAAHCVNGASPGTFTLAGTVYTVSERYTNPSWQGVNVLSAGGDIALLKLATAVIGVTPAPLYSGGDERGRPGVHVGYGNDGVGSTGNTGSGFGVKRAAQNVGDVFGGAVLLRNTASGPDVPFSDDFLVADFDTPSLLTTRLSALGSSDVPFELEGSINFGDSGGAFFIDNNGKWELAGVHSWIDGISVGGDGSDNASYTDLLGSTRVSSYRPWITQVSGVTAAPEPGSVLLFLVASSLTLAARRRKF